MPADDAVDDEELLGRDDDVCAVPAPDGHDREARREGEEGAPGQRGRPADREADDPEDGERQGPRERPHEHDAVPPCIEIDMLFGLREHRGCTLRQKGEDPWLWGELHAAQQSRRSSSAGSSSSRSLSGRSRS
jgi:hypothetical protein